MRQYFASWVYQRRRCLAEPAKHYLARQMRKNFREEPIGSIGSNFDPQCDEHLSFEAIAAYCEGPAEASADQFAAFDARHVLTNRHLASCERCRRVQMEAYALRRLRSLDGCAMYAPEIPVSRH